MLFISIVAFLATYLHTLFLPIFLGLLVWAKAWLQVGLQALLKLLTPKLGLVLLKNGVIIKGRDALVDVGTRMAVTSHRPWRQRLIGLKRALNERLLAGFRRYLDLPLWVRCAIAVVLLAITASSTWAVFALLIVPQPILTWLRQRMVAVLNKLGVLKSLDALWRWAMPARFRARWERYRIWTLGRRQLRAARELRARIGPRVTPGIDAARRLAAVRRTSRERLDE